MLKSSTNAKATDRSIITIIISWAIDQFLHLSNVLNSRRQVLIAIFGNQDVIFNSHTSNLPEFVQHIEVYVRGVNRICEVWLDDKAAEVNL